MEGRPRVLCGLRGSASTRAGTEEDLLQKVALNNFLLETEPCLGHSVDANLIKPQTLHPLYKNQPAGLLVPRLGSLSPVLASAVLFAQIDLP